EMQGLAQAVDTVLAEQEVRLTMGGEPTFVSIDDRDGAEWNFTAHSAEKWCLAADLLGRLQPRYAPGGMLHFGQGKWYPGEPLPRLALSCYWRTDGVALWSDPRWIAMQAPATPATTADTERFAKALAKQLGLHPGYLQPAHESVWNALRDESRLPVNVDPLSAEWVAPAAREKLREQLTKALGAVVGYVLPIKAGERKVAKDETKWQSSLWPLTAKHIFLLEGDSPMGYRLPLASLPWVAPKDVELHPPVDPFAPVEALPAAGKRGARREGAAPVTPKLRKGVSAPEIVRTALCMQVREDILHVFLPPVPLLEDFIDLISAIETAATETKTPLRLEGYSPPADVRIQKFAITPDPGVIEVNIHPAKDWRALAANTLILYEQAREARLSTEKFMLDGRHTGTGGGNHVTIGGVTPADSPLLRRPDLLHSLIGYWQNHPALSYLFSGTFIGPTSQSPRVDEARSDALYELEIAFEQLDAEFPLGAENEKPWLVDRILRHFLVDLTGNTHRAEFSIDKLYSPDGPTGRLGLLEFRAFEMPPHPQMSLAQMLLLRTLIARFWCEPYRHPLIRWGTELHDRFMLPYFIAQDMKSVVDDLNNTGHFGDHKLKFDWFAPFLEFRFPRFGTVAYQGIELELRQAIEPWHVLGEELSGNATSRYVDSSIERMQVRVTGMVQQRHIVACNGRPVPLTPTGTPGEYVAGVRYRAWAPPSALHPTIGIHAPLVFDIVDLWAGRSVGGCTYHVSHPGGRNYETFPVNAFEAEARRVARFHNIGHTPGPMKIDLEGRNSAFPFTLDLRKAPDLDGAQYVPIRTDADQQ
ncbi:MAG: transglutaminase family protein, partial [Betaproteobacteria bacterium]|nr:transglutaminase family protein [Betaproteobacteria bacterium]